jgi:hypothetical protein
VPLITFLSYEELEAWPLVMSPPPPPAADIACSKWFAALAKAAPVEPCPPKMPPADEAAFRFKLLNPLS